MEKACILNSLTPVILFHFLLSQFLSFSSISLAHSSTLALLQTLAFWLSFALTLADYNRFTSIDTYRMSNNKLMILKLQRIYKWNYSTTQLSMNWKANKIKWHERESILIWYFAHRQSDKGAECKMRSRYTTHFYQ